MVTAEQEKQVEELWKKQLSQRAIARTVGISRDVVRRIINRLTGNDSTSSSRGRVLLGSVDLPEPVIRRFSQRQGMCPRCRSVVYLPCLACQVRSWLRVKALWPTHPREPRQVHGVGKPPQFRTRCSVRR